MTGLPESFDVAKRLNLFNYLSFNSVERISVTNLFNKYQGDYEKFRININRYRSNCDSSKARKKFTIGLVTPKGNTSFIKYIRMCHWFKLLKYDRSYEMVLPTVKSYLVQNLSLKHGYNLFNFELPSIFKLMFTFIIIHEDRDLIVPFIRSINKIKPSITDFSSDEFKLQYLYDLKETHIDLLNNRLLSTKEYTSALKRIEYYDENISLMNLGRNPKRGIQHMIEPRLHWLLDLLLVDPMILCSSGIVSPIKCWKKVEVSTESIYIENDFFKTYIETLPYINSKKKSIEGIFKNMTESYELLRNYYGSFIKVEDLLFLTWLLSNSNEKKYTTFQRLFQEIDANYEIYSRKMKGMGLIRS